MLCGNYILSNRSEWTFYFYQVFNLILQSAKQKELTDDQKEFRAEVYRYAFRQERNYLGKIAQQEQEYRHGFLVLYREILIAEVIFLGDEEE